MLRINKKEWKIKDYRVKLKESEKRDTLQDLARELKTMEYEDDSDTNCNWYTHNNFQRIGKGIGKLEK